MKNLIVVFAVIAGTFIAANNSFAQNQYNQMVNNSGNWFKVEKPLILGSNTNRRPIIEINLNSNDKGKNFGGQVKYAQKEGILSIKLTRTKDCNYDVCTYSAFTKKGNADWVSDGVWKMQSGDYLIHKINAKSSDNGKNLTGNFTVYNDGTNVLAFEFKATLK